MYCVVQDTVDEHRVCAIGGQQQRSGGTFAVQENAPLNMDDDEDDDEEEGRVEILDDYDDGSLITLSLYYLLYKIK